MYDLVKYSNSKQFFLYEHIIDNDNKIVFDDGSTIVLPQSVVDTFKKYLSYIHFDDSDFKAAVISNLRNQHISFALNCAIDLMCASFNSNHTGYEDVLNEITYDESFTAKECTRMYYVLTYYSDMFGHNKLNTLMSSFRDVLVNYIQEIPSVESYATLLDTYLKCNESFIIETYLTLFVRFTNDFFLVCNPVHKGEVINKYLCAGLDCSTNVKSLVSDILTHWTEYISSPGKLQHRLTALSTAEYDYNNKIDKLIDRLCITDYDGGVE